MGLFPSSYITYKGRDYQLFAFTSDEDAEWREEIVQSLRSLFKNAEQVPTPFEEHLVFYNNYEIHQCLLVSKEIMSLLNTLVSFVPDDNPFVQRWCQNVWRDNPYFGFENVPDDDKDISFFPKDQEHP